MRGDNKGKLEEMVREYRKAVAPATDEQKDRSSASQPALEALAVPSGTPLSTFDPNTYPACYPEYFYGDCVPFLERKRPVTCQQVFAALPDREELEYTLPSDDITHPYKAAVKSRFDTPEFYAAHADILRRVRTLGTVNASLARQGFEQDWHLIAATTSKDFVDAALAQQKPRHNSDIMNSPTITRAQKAVSNLLFSTAMVPLSDGYKMRLKHTGSAMNQSFGPLTAFSTHNYADNYSPEIAARHGGGAPQPVAQEPVMPTLQQMHRMTAESPRSTAKQFLLMEELSFRHLYGVGRIRLGNFVVQSPVSTYAFEDDFASSGARGLVDYLAAALKVIEAQMRGYAHGHGKSHSVPNGHDEQKQIVQTVAAQIANLGNNADVAAVEKIVQAATEEYNRKLIASEVNTIISAIASADRRCSQPSAAQKLFRTPS